MTRCLAAVLAICLVLPGAAAALTMREVKDIYEGSARSKPRRMIEFRDQVYFDADDGVHGHELWRTDGTKSGTQLAVDIYPGPDSSLPEGPILNVDDSLYFAASDNEGRSVFRSDGTPAGTAPVPGTEGLNPFLFVPAAHRFYFRVPLPDPYGGSGTTLWASDGTQGGTTPLGDQPYINESPQCAASSSAATRLVTVGDVAYFCSYDPQHGSELWRSNGTQTGTQMVADLAPGPASAVPLWITPFRKDVIFFTSADGRTQLWRTDGTAAGTTPITTLPDTEDVDLPVVADGRIFFFAPRPNQSVLWSSDGTAAGTTSVQHLPFWQGHGEVVAGPGRTILFTAYSKRFGNELWRSDGTTAGTRLVKDIAPGRKNGYGTSSAPLQLTPAADGAVYFTATVPRRGRELWRTDGSRKGTTLVGEVRRGRHGGRIAAITPIGDRVFFAATTPRDGEELWVARPRGG
jgi:ELWxxDGT repeat protein